MKQYWKNSKKELKDVGSIMSALIIANVVAGFVFGVFPNPSSLTFYKVGILIVGALFLLCVYLIKNRANDVKNLWKKKSKNVGDFIFYIVFFSIALSVIMFVFKIFPDFIESIKYSDPVLYKIGVLLSAGMALSPIYLMIDK